MSITNHHYLVLIALGSDRIGILEALTKVAKQCGCNILESKSSKYGQECSMMFHLSGTWGAIAKIEAALPALAKQEDLAIQIKRTTSQQNDTALPYQVQISAKDRPGILNELAWFFTEQEISIERVECETYIAKNDTSIANIQLLIDIPIKHHIATLRDKFMSYCEDRNLDALIEPHK